jgi:hypothetical protein
MTELTIEAFLTRIQDTEYLPDWANEGAAELLDNKPKLKLIKLTGKACPLALTITPLNAAPHNRVFRPTKDGKGHYSFTGSLCITEDCQMWEKSINDCGLKNK